MTEAEPTTETASPKVHQGWKTYAAAGFLVLQAAAMALGWTEPSGETVGALIANAAVLAGFLRAGLRRLELFVEAKTGWEIPDVLVDQIAEKVAEKAAAKLSGAEPPAPTKPEDPA